MKKTVLLITTLTLSLYAEIFNVSTTAELRTALSTAYSNVDANDTINLAAGVYRTTDDGGGTFSVSDVTLIGSTTGETILDGDNTNTVITGSNTRLENITITHGNNVNSINRGAGIVGTLVTVVNCKIINNNAEYGATYGAGVYGNSFTSINSLFYNNTGSNYGDHIYGSNVIAINSIFMGRDAIHAGVYDQGVYDSSIGAYVASPDGLLVNNAYIDSSFYLQYGNALEVNNINYSLLEAQDIFVDFDNADYQLKAGSPLIDAGTQDTNRTTLPATDMIGNPRIEGLAVDIGPYEYQQAEILNVSTINVSTTAELRAALSTASTTVDVNDIINLAAGVYRTTDDGGGTFSVSDVTLIGSTAGETILDGDNTNTVITGSNTRLENITITHGNNVNSSNRGAGIVGTLVTVVNCKIINNNAEYGATYGAGVYGNSFTSINSLFYNNTGSNYGDHIYGSNVIAINSIFMGRDAIHAGVYDQGVYDSSIGAYVASPDGLLVNNAYIDSSFYLQYGNALEVNNINYSLLEAQDIFVDFDNADYQLKAGSPLIDAGTQDTNRTTLPATDMIGNPRIEGLAVDIGPYEYQTNESKAANPVNITNILYMLLM